VSNEEKMLFQTDPDRFWQTITDDDAEKRFAAAATLDDLLLCEVIRYGTRAGAGCLNSFSASISGASAGVRSRLSASTQAVNDRIKSGHDDVTMFLSRPYDPANNASMAAAMRSSM
jgi:hypothetical protein